MTLGQFIEQLIRSQLMSAEEVAAFQESLPAEQRPRDAEGLAKALVRGEKLTRFQAAMIYHGKTKLLSLGNYVLLEKIGAGGMGQVYKAHHRRMKREVALKILPSISESGLALRRFENEIEAAARLVHPHIVAAYDADEAKGIHFLVMEYVRGTDLRTLVRNHGAVTSDRALDFVIQAARGLQHAHAHGVIHRDVKPGNLLLSECGIVKVLDLGLARVRRSISAATSHNGRGGPNRSIVGTVDFISPEQATDFQSADARSDIYSLGCTLFFLLTGRPPYEGETPTQKLMGHLEGSVPSLRKIADVSPEVDAAVRRMMAKKPDDRFESMGEVILELTALLAMESRDTRHADFGLSTSPLEMPSDHGSTAQTPPPRERASGKASIRVVLADDHELVRAGLRTLLNGFSGVELLGEAANGHEALELFRMHQPDVAILDVEMPGLNGLDVLHRVAGELPKTRIIMLSMHSNEEYVICAMHAGAAGYLLKDAAARELELAIRAVARGETYLSLAVSKHVIAQYLRRVSNVA